MKRKKNHLGIYMLTGMLLVMGVAAPKMIAFAGDINGNEAGVIAAASGTFSYDGKTYKAGTAYINSLTAYLAADDVDLTAEQASEAINKMYASVAEGVSQGYLYEVGGESGEQETDESEAQEGKTENADKDSKSETSKTETDTQPAVPQKNGEVDVWGAMSNPTETKTKLKERPEQNDAAVSVQLEDGDLVVTTKDKEDIHLTRNEQMIPGKVIEGVNALAAVLFVITLVCFALLLFHKCMSFRKPKNRRARPGHTRRRRVRRYTRNVLTATTAISLVGLFIMLGLYMSLFSKDKIMQNMQSSGYFRYAYSEYISGLATEVQEGKEVTELDNIASYEDYLLMIKQNSLKILDGETDIRIPDSNVAPYIYNIKQSFMRAASVAGVLMAVNVLAGVILMIFMDQKRERGVKHLAVAELVASAVVVAVTIYMALVRPYTQLYIKPDYLYLFLMECIQWGVKVMTSITAFCVAFGMILIGVYKTVSDSED